MSGAASAARRYSGNGWDCAPCILNVSVAGKSFDGATVARSQAVRLFGSVAVPAATRQARLPGNATAVPFVATGAAGATGASTVTCGPGKGFSIAWSGFSTGNAPIPLTLAVNQAASPTLLLPARALPLVRLCASVPPLSGCRLPPSRWQCAAPSFCALGPFSSRPAAAAVARLKRPRAKAPTGSGRPPLGPIRGKPLALGVPPQNALARFSIQACYSSNPEPALCSGDSVSFTTVASPLLVSVTGANTAVGRGPVVLDASQSSDPDGDPGSPASLSFAWACSLQPPQAAPSAALGPCLSFDSSPAVLPPGPSVTVQLMGSQLGTQYYITATVSKGSRSSNLTMFLTVKQSVIPTIALRALSAARVSPSDKVTLYATASSSFPASLQTTWTVASPPAYANLLSQPGVLGGPITSPSLVLRPNALPARQTLVFQLTASDGVGSARRASVRPKPALEKPKPANALAAIPCRIDAASCRCTTHNPTRRRAALPSGAHCIRALNAAHHVRAAQRTHPTHRPIACGLIEARPCPRAR